ncbi:MAG TPA: PilN domain-containing protein [Actinomycetota bacterium]|nr:PilN domain-containing protein [Actinomycetota bacterium]
MRVNLLPPELFERQRIRRRTVLVVVFGVIVLAAVGAFYALQVIRLGEVEDDIRTQESENAALRQEIADLQDIEALQQEIRDTRDLLATLLADRVLWSGILRDISLVIPPETWLTGLSGTLGTAAPAGEETAEPVQVAGLVGQISFTGRAFDHRDVALWLSRLEDVRGFINPWLTTSTSTVIGETDAVEFNSSVDLSEQALARRTGGAG